MSQLGLEPVIIAPLTAQPELAADEAGLGPAARAGELRRGRVAAHRQEKLLEAQLTGLVGGGADVVPGSSARNPIAHRPA
jgi:hypothetical protein